MDRWRAGLVIGIGAASVVVLLGGIYKIAQYFDHDDEEEATENGRKTKKRNKTPHMDRLPKMPSASNLLAASDAESGQDSDKDAGKQIERFEIATIPTAKVRRFKVLLMGEIDSAQWEDDDGHLHDVLVQYCGYTNNSPTASTSQLLKPVEHRLLGAPLGRLLFDDGSMAIVYKGGGSDLSVLGHDGMRMAVTVKAMKELVQLLFILEKSGVSVPEAILKKSVVVHDGGHVRLLGRHGWQAAKSEGNGSGRAFIKLADDALKIVTTDTEQGRRLAKELMALSSLSQLDRKLANHTHH